VSEQDTIRLDQWKFWIKYTCKFTYVKWEEFVGSFLACYGFDIFSPKMELCLR